MTPGQPPPTIIPKLIVGLGNPEAKYEQTRHNIGFSAVEALARAWHFPWKNQPRFQGLLAEGTQEGVGSLRLLKPLTYMNRSGQSVRAAMDWYKLPPEAILVIYDDMDLPLGRLRMRLAGSAGGHNGMKSILSHLPSDQFPRLRIGIGRSAHKARTVSHVLSRFSPQEMLVVSQVLQLAVEAVELSLKAGVAKAMSLYNSRQVGGQGESEADLR